MDGVTAGTSFTLPSTGPVTRRYSPKPSPIEMSTYAIGDVQGCFDELQALLIRIEFSPDRDRLLFCGDLVNRGPKSLEALRFARALGSATMVLGNHDLHLLAVHEGGKCGRRDTLDAVLAAPDREELMDWLAHQPLAYRDPGSGILLVHAGLPPQWTGDEALHLAEELGAVIRNPVTRRSFLSGMYGDQPDEWTASLKGIRRQRFIVNCFTRLRYCSAGGKLDLRAKGVPGSQPEGLLPWFQVPGRRSEHETIAFGHWSTLGQVEWPEHSVYGLDTGGIWGGRLTALCLDDGRLHSVPGTPYSSFD